MLRIIKGEIKKNNMNRFKCPICKKSITGIKIIIFCNVETIGFNYPEHRYLGTKYIFLNCKCEINKPNENLKHEILLKIFIKRFLKIKRNNIKYYSISREVKCR